MRVPRGTFRFQITEIDPTTGLPKRWTDLVPEIEVDAWDAGTDASDGQSIDLDANTLASNWRDGAAPCIGDPTAAPPAGTSPGTTPGRLLTLGDYTEVMIDIDVQEHVERVFDDDEKKELNKANTISPFLWVFRGSWSGNTFTATWDDTDDDDSATQTDKGSMTVTLAADHDSVAQFEVNSSETYSGKIVDSTTTWDDGASGAICRACRCRATCATRPRATRRARRWRH